MGRYQLFIKHQITPSDVLEVLTGKNYMQLIQTRFVTLKQNRNNIIIVNNKCNNLQMHVKILEDGSSAMKHLGILYVMHDF
jgi:hypothetical protein